MIARVSMGGVVRFGGRLGKGFACGGGRGGLRMGRGGGIDPPPLGDRLTVGQQTLTLLIVVRIHVPQPACHSCSLVKDLSNLSDLGVPW